MNRFLTVLAFSLMLLGIPNAHARNSAASYDNKFYSQQEFVQAYNNTTATIFRDYTVGLDTSPAINPNNNLGQYVTEQTTSTTDSVFVFGVADETIPAGQLGRICIRGPHKVMFNEVSGPQGPGFSISAGTVISQCANNTTTFTNPSVGGSVNGGVACPYSTATGTAGGMLGYVLSTTATTDTGDASQTGAMNSTGSEFWTWIDPQILR